MTTWCLTSCAFGCWWLQTWLLWWCSMFDATISHCITKKITINSANDLKKIARFFRGLFTELIAIFSFVIGSFNWLILIKWRDADVDIFVVSLCRLLFQLKRFYLHCSPEKYTFFLIISYNYDLYTGLHLWKCIPFVILC